jgi:serralysin
MWVADNLTYSFPTDASYYESFSYEAHNNFGTLNGVMQTAVTKILGMFSMVINVGFTLLTETLTEHAYLRFGMSDSTGTAWAYLPSVHPLGGDVWFNNSSGTYSNPDMGNYAFQTFLHEIGHAMGLKHPHEDPMMPADRNSMEWTVMSYKSSTSAEFGGYSNETWGYSQTLMLYDIAALQHLYGANFTSYSGNTTYAWNPTTGEMSIDGVSQGAAGDNRIFQTVWDGGGEDTYDFSSYSASVTVNLRPGEWTTTSADQLASLDWSGVKAVGNIANAFLHNDDLRSLIENAVGGSGHDTITGNQTANRLVGGAGKDTLTGGGGNDRLEGGTGNDTAMFAGSRASYSVTLIEDGSLTVTDLRDGSPDGIDTLWSIEYLGFSDVTLSAVEFGGPAPEVEVTPPLPPTTPTTPSTPTTPTTPPTTPTLPPLPSGNVVKGTSGTDVISSSSGKAPLRSTEEADTISGGAGNDTIKGHGGDDVINGGSGMDKIYGGKGKDVFVFNTKASKANVDKVVDFVVKDDSFWLDNKVFNKLGKKGSEASPAKMDKKFFTIGPKAKDKDDYVIYDNKKGVLYYDADGSGKGKPVEIATLPKSLKMTAADFFVI